MSGEEKRKLTVIGGSILAAAIIIAVTLVALGLTGNLISFANNVKNEELEIILDGDNTLLYQDAARVSLRSAVNIRCGGANGSGVVVSQDSAGNLYILTNDHVLVNGGIIMAEFTDPDGSVKKVIAEAVGEKYSGDMDLALIKVSNIKVMSQDITAVPVTFANDDSVVFGRSCIMIGNPKGLGTMVATGIVSNPSYELVHPKQPHNFVAFSSSVNAGNSGGGLYDIEGKLIGIVTLRQTDDSLNNENVVFGIGYAISLDDIRSYLGAYGMAW